MVAIHFVSPWYDDSPLTGRKTPGVDVTVMLYNNAQLALRRVCVRCAREWVCVSRLRRWSSEEQTRPQNYLSLNVYMYQIVFVCLGNTFGFYFIDPRCIIIKEVNMCMCIRSLLMMVVCLFVCPFDLIAPPCIIINRNPVAREQLREFTLLSV